MPVNCPKTDTDGPSDGFAPTHWSVIVAARETDSRPEAARRALEQLCRDYWSPAYAFVRARGYSVHDAQDLTQSFFLYLIEHELFARADRNRGRFRSFFLTSLRNFLVDAYEHERALKRGGGQEFLALDEKRTKSAESLFQTHYAGREANREEHLFERSWAETLLRRGLEQLKAQYEREGKGELFAELKVFLTGCAQPLPSYEELANEIGSKPATLRSSVNRMRNRYRGLLRAAVRQTVASEAEVDLEMHELFQVLTNA